MANEEVKAKAAADRAKYSKIKSRSKPLPKEESDKILDGIRKNIIKKR